MHRRLWLVAGVAVALLAVGATASATTTSSSSAKLAAAPFAQAWANVPRTPEAWLLHDCCERCGLPRPIPHASLSRSHQHPPRSGFAVERATLHLGDEFR